MNSEIHNDDEPIMRFNSNGGGSMKQTYEFPWLISEEEDADTDLDGGEIEARIFNKQVAPLEECPFKVLVELKGIGAKEGRLGVDLVTILDISGSMKGRKLEKMQLAMQFLVKKLSRVDRLSVVTFSRSANRLCPLRQITEDSQKEMVDQVNGLTAASTTNIEAGLTLALKILKDRTRTKNRSAAIMLMTDGVEDARSEAISVPLGDVPVYTFAFGADQCDPEVLSAIAKNSNGGTFSPVPDLDDLSVAFSTALAGLLNVSIEDLTLTVAPLNRSQLNEVNAGNYPQSEQDTVMETITVTFRSLYDRETRKVLALLTLPKVDARKGIQTCRLVYKYRVNGKDEFYSCTRDINVTRTDKQPDEERPEVLAEETRIRTASSIRVARLLADNKKLDEAREKLIAAGTSLAEIDAILKSQVDHLILLMVSQETYEEQGRAYALALEASHQSQRATALPAGVKSGFEIPLVGEYNNQAKAHSLDPENYVVPTVEEDKKAIAPPTVEVDEPIRDLAHRLAETLKTLDSKAPTKQVDLAKVREISDLSQRLARKLDLHDTLFMAEKEKQAEHYSMVPENYIVPTAEKDMVATAPPLPPATQVDLPNRVQEIHDLVNILAQKENGIEELLAAINSLQVLHIRSLENKRGGIEGAERAKLNGQHLRDLYLYWGNDNDDYEYTSTSVDDGKMLEGLKPHPNLKKLIISGFEGLKLPNWMGSSDCLPNVVELHLLECNSCEWVLPLGMLPCLRVLKIKGMNSVKCLGKEFYCHHEQDIDTPKLATRASSGIPLFPVLIELILMDMSLLEEMVGPPHYYNSFPSLESLIINNCSRLKSVPLSSCSSLKKLELRNTNDDVVNSILASNGGRQQLSSLKFVSIQDSPQLIFFPVGLLQNDVTLIQSLEIVHCSEFQGFRILNKNTDYTEYVSSDPEFISISSLRSLKLSNCPTLASLPDLRKLASLTELRIENCDKLKNSFPYDLASLQNLNTLIR